MGIESLLDDNFIANQGKETPVEEVKEPIKEGGDAEIKVEDKSEPIEIKDEPKFELNEDVVRNYIKEQREKDENSFSDYFKEAEVKEVVKEVNPYADIQDDYVTNYMKFRKETGLSRKEFDFVQQDFSKKT